MDFRAPGPPISTSPSCEQPCLPILAAWDNEAGAGQRMCDRIAAVGERDRGGRGTGIAAAGQRQVRVEIRQHPGGLPRRHGEDDYGPSAQTSRRRVQCEWWPCVEAIDWTPPSAHVRGDSSAASRCARLPMP